MSCGNPFEDGPLAGYRVLELGTTAAGPFCARLLADFGAEVVKVEAAEGDPIRWMGKTFHGKSLYAASICRNKHLISVDLRNAEGQAVIRSLLPKFDVVVENFRPGTLEKWGLGYEDMCQVRPDLIMVRISGYGQTGPYSSRPGYGIIAEALSGLRRINGDPDRPPGRLAIALTDYITAVYAAFGATMALLFREKTGLGQQIDAALYESAFSFMEPHVPAFEKTGYVANRLGSRLPDSTPNNLYATRDEEFIHITAMTDQIFRRLCNAMGQPGVADDARFLSQTLRTQHEDELDDLVAEWTTSHDLKEIEQRLQAVSVPASPIYSMKDIFSDPHYSAREMLVPVPDEELGKVTLAGITPKLSLTPGKLKWAGRTLGHDTRRVLKEIAGLSDEKIDVLIRDKVVFTATSATTVGNK